MNIPRPRSRPVLGETRIVDLVAKPRFEEVVRLLGNRAKAPPRPKVKKQILDMEPVALSLCRPAAVYGIWSRESLSNISLPNDWSEKVDHVALAAVTTGEALENKVRNMSESTSLAKASILDAYGSDLAEVTAEVVDAMICLEAAALNLSSGRRRSPGYAAFAIAEQKPLLAALVAESIGIHLTPSMLMQPQKSISFAKPLGALLPENDSQNSCRFCDMEKCVHRKTLGDIR
ncbi:MAG: hypothetical protein GY854_11770 [Deltaproteobacteria bacterium]|nr:hypothetical protein [Deltaproteobacteria bacterium]